MSTFFNDIKHGFRILAKQPLFTVVATLTLALGIGANIFMFSIVNAYLLFPLPFPDAGRLVDLTDTNSGFGRMSVAYANFLDWRQQNQTLEQVACYRNVHSTLGGVETPERIQGKQINAGLFPMLGVAPALGRLFSPSDDHAQAERTVVLSHACWQKRFGAAPEALGQSMVLDGDAYTVIGVLPATFRFPAYYLHGAEFWTSIGLLEKQASFMQRSNHSGTCAIGKLKPGVTLAQARADFKRVAEQLEQIYPDTNGGCRVAVTGYRQQLMGNDGFPYIVFMGAVTFVLLIVCVNVANLLLVRFNARLQEFSVRSALGAGRWRLARQLLCENLPLALLGGAGGVFVGFGGIHLLIALLGVPSWAAPEPLFHPDMNVLLFVLGTTLGTALIFGLLPAGFVVRSNLSPNLTGPAHGTTCARGHARLRNTLVLAQIAMALALLFGAGLMLRSFLCHLQADPGYNPANAVAMNLHLSDQTYNSPDKQIACYREFLRGIKPLPGVSYVGLGIRLMGGWQAPYYVENAPIPEPGHQPHAEFNRVSSDYFKAMGMRLLEGRPFAPSDNRDAPWVV